MSKSQKFIKVISIIDIIFGVFGLVIGVLGATGSFIAASKTTDAAVAATDVAGFGGAMIMLAIACIFEIIVGILGLRAAKDASKIMPVFVLSIISLATGIVSLILSITGGSFQASDLASVVGSALMVFCANNVRKQAQG